MTLKDQLDALLDATVFDSTGTKIGAVRQVYVDDASGKLTFATVSTGIFSSDAIVPLHGARLLDDELHVDHTRSVIRDSPRPDHTEDALTADQEFRLLEYYGIEAPVRGQESAPSRPRGAAPAGGTSVSSAPESESPESGTTRSATPQSRTPAERPPAEKTDDTTASSPKPEVGETRKATEPGAGKAPEPVRPAAPDAEATGSGADQAGGTEPGKPKGAAREPKGGSGSATSPDRG